MNTKAKLLLATFLLTSLSPVFGGKLLNISTRVQVETGDAVLVNEFIVQGSTPKKVILRGIGPSLSGVAGALADPVLELYGPDDKLVIRNDDWQQAPNQQEIKDSGIAPTNPKESAILRTVAPGRYSVFLRGASNTTGVGLNEVYDFGGEAVLVALGSRARVGTGENSLIAGFFVGGETPQDVIVRALGKSLAAANIAGALQDPILEVYDGNGSVVANDNWQSSQQAAIQNSGLAPTDAHESALIASLSPGAYTAIVRGVGDTSGIGFVQVYALPFSGKPMDPAPGPPPPPIRFEAETLAVSGQSATHSIFNDPHLSGNAGTLLSNVTVGSFVTYAVPVPRPGTYRIKVKFRTGAKRGIFQLAINGTNRGAAQDEYSAAINYPTRDLGLVNFPTAGNKSFRFTVTGRNANSGGSAIDFDAIDLVPQ